MTTQADAKAWSARGRIRADLIYLGWQPSQLDPGPPPAPPKMAEPDEVNPAWVAAQRRECARLARPARVTLLACLGLAVADLACWLAYSAALAAVAGAGIVGVAAIACWRIGHGQRALAAGLRAEQGRVARFRDVQRTEFAARQRQYARLHWDWQRRTAASWRQPQWYPVTLPASLHRVDVAGGTLAGWSALLTTFAVPRLAAGGEVTVLDLTEGGVAADLIEVARHLDIDPAVWVLPADLASLQLGADLSSAFLADALAQTAGTANVATDSALLSRVLAALTDGATMPKVLAALRALGQIGAPEQHLAATLSQRELIALSAMAGRGAERLVVDRAWELEARLRVLAPLATGRPMSCRRLNVAWLGGTPVENATLAAYLAVAITATFRQAPAGPPWRRTIVLLGAERLTGEVLDRLCDATEQARAGLVLGYRSIPTHVRERLGRGNCAVAFMRLGNAEEARFAAEQIGTVHRLVVSQLTDTVGTSVTDTSGDSYTSTASDSLTRSDSVTVGRSRGRRDAPFGPASRDSSATISVSVSEGISTGTSWGISTSRAVGASDSQARTAQRSREFLVEQHELQQLPPSAVILAGRQVLLADANPAIMALPTATLASQ